MSKSKRMYTKKAEGVRYHLYTNQWWVDNVDTDPRASTNYCTNIPKILGLTAGMQSGKMPPALW
jgi:spore coat protein U-like protein